MKASWITKNTKTITKDAKGFRVSLALAAVLVLALVFAAAALASESVPFIDWQVISGGGSSASGGSVTIDSSLGQPITGNSTGENAWLGAGYWYAEQPVQLFLPVLRR